MRELSKDIVIVGGGPAGLSAGKRAAELGLDALVVEKQYEIGQPIRTSGASFIDEMKELGVPRGLYNPVRKCTFATRTKTAEFVYDEPLACILDVRGLYQHIATEAVKNGCEIMLGAEAKSPIIESGSVKGVTAKRSDAEFKINAKVTVDASGFPASISRKAGIFPKESPRFGNGVEYEAYVENLDPEKVYLLVGDMALTGYGWIFPLSKNRARIGIGVTRPDSKQSPMKLLDDLIENRPKIMEDMGRINPIEIHAGNIPIEPLTGSFATNGLMAVGDAATQANLIVGEGIRICMRYGRLAAETAAEAIKKKDLSKKGFAKYEKEVQKLLKINQIGLAAQRRMAAASADDWDKIVGETLANITDLPADDFATLLKGDFTKKNVLSLLARNRKLLKIGVMQIAKKMA